MDRPRISELNTWENYRNTIFMIIREALLLLRTKENLPQIEDNPAKPNLNRRLFFCFREICYLKQLKFHLPVPNARNLPFRNVDEPESRENTLPDFRWQFIDHLAEEDNCECHFIVECKRIGKQSSSSWNFNENYVNNGICRFITPEHGYGKGDDTCGMIGYIQSMNFPEILEEINMAILTNPEPISVLEPPESGWKEFGVSELMHIVARPFEISPFRLFHFWIDLRDKY